MYDEDQTDEIELRRKDKIDSRRRQVWQLKARQIPTKEIATLLGVSISTVRNDIKLMESTFKDNDFNLNRSLFVAGQTEQYNQLVEQGFRGMSQATSHGDKVRYMTLLTKLFKERSKFFVDFGVLTEIDPDASENGKRVQGAVQSMTERDLDTLALALIGDQSGMTLEEIKDVGFLHIQEDVPLSEAEERRREKARKPITSADESTWVQSVEEENDE